MIDWKLLESLRARFLSEEPGAGGDYWTDASLAAYDATFAQRIGWKWRAVLGELKVRGWTPPSDEVLDWACGTGIASRTYAEFFPGAKVKVWDRSSKAMAFAGGEPAESTTGVLLLSHVLGELSQKNEKALLERVASAAATIWVEPGTPLLSQKLISIRERLRDRFHLVAPCPHQAKCGLQGDTKHWCHHFAPPAPEAFTTSEWREFSTRMKIDLRSLPTSYLVLDSRRPPSTGGGRVIGRPRESKGYVRALVCREFGVLEEKIVDRLAPDLARIVRAGGFSVRLP